MRLTFAYQKDETHCGLIVKTPSEVDTHLGNSTEACRECECK